MTYKQRDDLVILSGALRLAQDETIAVLRKRIKAHLDLPKTQQVLAQDPQFTALFGTRHTRSAAPASPNEPGTSLAIDQGLSPLMDEADCQGHQLPSHFHPRPPEPPPNPNLFPIHPYYYIANNNPQETLAHFSHGLTSGFNENPYT